MTHCKIIADVGSNWFELEDILESVEACTADIFKIQHISSKKLYGKPSVKLVKEIPETWIPEIWNLCRTKGMGFMCSVFDDMDVTFISQFVDLHKIASAEITDENLLTSVADSGKHTLISTGMATEKEIRRALSFFQDGQVTLLYCESEYPSRSHWLGNITRLRDDYKVPVGFSDHSLDIYQIPDLAVVEYEVPFLEKHYGLERILRNRLTPDHPHSLNEHQFRAMVELIKHDKYKRVIDTTHRRIQKGDRWVRPV